LLIKVCFVYISILLLEDTESKKFLNYYRQVRNFKTKTALVLRKQCAGETEVMEVAQTFRKSKTL